MNKNSQGFTLIEILVVIGLIAVLAAIVLIAINPARQFAQGRNTQRTSNVEAILNSIGQDIADNKGTFTCSTGSIPTTGTSVPNPIPVGTTIAGAKRIAKLASPGPNDVDLGCLVPTYISSLPFDPDGSTGAHWNSPTDYDTEYYVIEDTSATGGNRITIYSPHNETAVTQPNFISLTR